MVVVQLFDKVVDIAHHVGEEEDTHKLDHHCKQVLVLLHWDYVSIPQGREGGKHPVYTGYVSGSLVVIFLFLVQEALVDPAFVVLKVLVAYIKPQTANEVRSEEKQEGKHYDSRQTDRKVDI